MIRWKKLQTADDVRAAVSAAIGDRATEAQVMSFAAAEKLTCGPLADAAVRCRVDGPRRGLLVRVVWLLTFRFADGTVSGVDVEQGMHGP